jgi:uncharacterized membrane protein YkgB
MLKAYLLKAATGRIYPARFNAVAVITWSNRIALAVVFCWFGVLKIFQLSPAETLVMHLHNVTIARFIPVQQFMVLLGVVECSIGLLWLFPKSTKLAFTLFLLQMTTTFMPMVFLRDETWQQSFVLTLTGQYIMKNLVLIASAITVVLLNENEAKDFH